MRHYRTTSLQTCCHGNLTVIDGLFRTTRRRIAIELKVSPTVFPQHLLCLTNNLPLPYRPCTRLHHLVPHKYWKSRSTTCSWVLQFLEFPTAVVPHFSVRAGGWFTERDPCSVSFSRAQWLLKTSLRDNADNTPIIHRLSLTLPYRSASLLSSDTSDISLSPTIQHITILTSFLSLFSKTCLHRDILSIVFGSRP